MEYNPRIHHRHSIRLVGYNYSHEGYYFITICTHEKRALFGTIENNQMIQNKTGRMIQSFWNEMPKYYSGIKIDAFQVMPNHVHGIIVIVGAGPCACPNKLSLGDIVGRFKSITANKYVRDIKQIKFKEKLWQRNYYERIIRNEQALMNTREYIIKNPCNWDKDELFMEL